MENKLFVPGDPVLIENIVSYLKAKGIFDEFRHECLADVDTKSSCQNLSQRVDGYTTKFLSSETWNPDLNKNELRNKLRKNIDESGMLAVGADHVVEQVINPKIGQSFLPKIVEVVHQYLKEENEKLSKKQESINENVNVDKQGTENVEPNTNKVKTPVIDPIADILSFTYSKPKTIPSISSQKSENVYKKGTDIQIKTERKKEEISSSAKITDFMLKNEKKEDEINQTGKSVENPLKVEVKENVIQIKNIDVTVKSEKQMEETILQTENNESANEYVAPVIKIPVEIKETKLKKEIKYDDSEAFKVEAKDVKIKKEGKSEEAKVDLQKKAQIEDIKLDKKKPEESKFIEETNSSDENKSLSTTSKTNSHGKSKLDIDKSRKIKSHGTLKSTSSVNDQQKKISKEISDGKTLFEKHSKSVSSKFPKTSSKQLPSNSKSGLSKSLKKDNLEDDNVKTKTVDSNKVSLSSTKKSSSKSFVSKSENTISKTKHIIDKTEKDKSSKNQSVLPKIHSQTSISGSEKSNKSIHYSSSYDSSQGSDQDKSNLFNVDMPKKQKHYSKHHKKEASTKSSSKNQKDTSDSKRSHVLSDSLSEKKHKSEKDLKTSLQKKLKEKTMFQDSAKISSRSDSFGSTSSTSDSSNICRDTLPSSSEETSESSSKSQEKKKKSSDKERCSTFHNLPPPPPPPPPSDSAVAENSSSPDVTTHSSQESDSEVNCSNMSDSDSDEDSGSSVLNSEVESSDASDIFDVLLYSSSSSEFEGFCSSPERDKQSSASDESESSVHTSDLSSYEDEINVEDLCLDNMFHSSDQLVKKKLTLKEAQEILKAKEDQRICNAAKDSLTNTSLVDKVPEVASQMSVLSSEEEVSPLLEPRRELRRERKLNPKYASNEYTSIFNSKRSSFITKNLNLSPPKQTLHASSKIIPDNVSEIREENPKEKTTKDISNQNNCKKRKISNSATSNLQEDSALSLPTHCESKSDIKTNEVISGCREDLISNEKNVNSLIEGDAAIRLTLNNKNSSITKSDVTKELNPNGMKRKFESLLDKTANKRLCRRNSLDSSNSQNICNENKLYNSENINTMLSSAIEPKNNLHKQKANGDVLGKNDRLRKSTQSKSKYASEKK